MGRSAGTEAFDLWSGGEGGERKTSRSQAVNKATDFDARTS